MNCEHENFVALVKVARITDGEDGPVTHYSADIWVKCSECGLPFVFVGVPGGFSPAQPMTNFDGTELRAPIKPSTDPVDEVNSLLTRSSN